MGDQNTPPPSELSGTKAELYVTGFASQKLMGYQCDSNGKFIVKVFRAEVYLSDGSQRVIFGTKSYSGFDDVEWDWQCKKTQPFIHRDNFGIWVVDLEDYSQVTAVKVSRLS